MSKFFKNTKSEGDGEYRSVEKFKIKPRSFSCKPDIGPSGDHKQLETPTIDIKPNYRVNMWLNNIGSGSSQNSCNSSELYKLNDDYLEQINFIRKKLEMTELEEPQESPDEVSTNAIEVFKKDSSDLYVCTLNDDCGFCKQNREQSESKTSPQIRPSLSSISEKSKISDVTTHSSVRYRPPLKKPCYRPDASAPVSIESKRTNHSKTDAADIPVLNLNNEPFSQCNENKSIQCTSRDTELTDHTSHSTDHSKQIRNHQRHIGDNIDLVEVDLYLEPEIVLKQPVKTTKNCIKFLPIEDEEVSTSEKSNKNDFYDEIVSNCSFNFGQRLTPIVPSHDSFFKSKKKARKRRFRRRERSKLEGVKLEKSSIDIHRTYPDTSETSDPVQEIETNEIPAINGEGDSENLDDKLMMGLALPTRTLRPVKLPLTAKISQLIYGKKCETEKVEEDEIYTFEEDISSAQSGVRQCNNYVRVGTEYSNYREAAEDLLTIGGGRTDDMKENACLHKKSSRTKSTNKYNTKKRQSVDYDFYSVDLPTACANHGVLYLNQETEEDSSDSGCLKAIENCCCIRRIFKRRRSRYFSR
ncbi:uncharacterized protein LOC123674472 [Harmonia axyridis]|uniref:uncharacterized protein LOC123674472 n=1 Tax=Harmonia axyridis TaxID=115357 RepID=UPI001E276C19|nr:uncharacterized protein LOC123674472 [Harmonia axyridis]